MCGTLLLMICVLRKKRKRKQQQAVQADAAAAAVAAKQAPQTTTTASQPPTTAVTASAEPGAIAIAMTSTPRHDSLYTRPKTTAAATAMDDADIDLPKSPPHITIHPAIHNLLQPTSVVRQHQHNHLHRMSQLTTGGGAVVGEREAADIDRDPSVCDDEKLSRCSGSHTMDIDAAMNVITPRTLQFDEHDSSDEDTAVLALDNHSKLHARTHPHTHAKSAMTLSHKSMHRYVHTLHLQQSSANSRVSMPSLHDVCEQVINRQGSTDEMYEDDAIVDVQHKMVVDVNGVVRTQGQGGHQDVDLEEDECDEAMEDMYTSDHEGSGKTPVGSDE